MFLGRRARMVALLPEDAREILGPVGHDLPCPSDGERTADRCQHLLSQLQEWAPEISNHAHRFERQLH
eukprot:12915821-Alexandrium_andersonii.AAC.1